MRDPAFCNTEGGRKLTLALLSVVGVPAERATAVELKINSHGPLTIRVTVDVVPSNSQADELAEIIRRFDIPSVVERS